MNKISIPYYLRFLGKVFVWSVLVMAVLRLFLVYYVKIPNLNWFDGSVLKAMAIGLQFDAVIVSYILALPLLLLFVHNIAKLRSLFIPRFLQVYFSLVLPVTLFILFEDIPYFDFFHNRLTESAFQWLNNISIVFSMIVESTRNLLFLIVAVLSFIGLTYFVYRYTSKELVNYPWQHARLTKSSEIPFFVLALALCFMGLRGKIDRPIRQGDAFFGSDPILNQIGLNPVFTLLKSYTEKVNLMDNSEALTKTLTLLNIKNSDPSISPLARFVEPKGDAKKVNIVLVLMESMSGNYMSRFGNSKNLTPTLDSLSNVSWFFENGYSAGIHTNNGVFSTLYSFPALKRVRPMSMVPARQYSGLPYALKQNGYTNIFFTSHDETFDNLGTFIPANYFDKLYSAKDYPTEKLLGTFGVPDDYLFSYALDKLNQADASKPFFATILTTSNHEPYAVPEEFKSTFPEKDLRAVNYADWSIQQFLNAAKKTAWYQNTLFVFVSDHGLVVGDNPYDLPLSYHHIPMILHAPSILGDPKVLSEYIGQIDLYPTLMGILNMPHTNNTLGVDVIKNPRPCIYFSADNKAGCLNKDYLYVYRFDGGGESLYKYQTGDQTDYKEKEEKQKAFLKEYVFSQIQTAEYIFSKDLAKISNKK
ncbi:MAG: hypothetical protein CFE21_10695 [Bacteroidetes bacterium B1(2017)]|nr:MAG: hypothetical protein CFE21_10695 [Bacteroidetes bacterium B1(2017)]